MKAKTILGLAIIVGVSACGGSPISHTELVDACNEAGNWSEKTCQCIADKAMGDLSSDGQRLLYASLTEDRELAEKLTHEMSLDEATKASMFMVDTVLSCTIASEDE